MMTSFTKFFPVSASASKSKIDPLYIGVATVSEIGSIVIFLMTMINVNKREAVSQLGLNSSIALFIPARKPGRSGEPR